MEAKVTEYEGKLKDNLFINGNNPGKVDAETLELFKKEKYIPDQTKNPNLWAWYSLVVLFEGEVVKSWKEEKGKKGGKKEQKEKKKEEKEDDFDPFAEETEEEKAALEGKKGKKEDKKKKKQKEVDKSLIMLEVKGYESDQDLDALAKKIINEVKRDGLLWKTEYKFQEIAFGIKKIIMACVVEDEKVSIDEVVEEIEGFKDEVQSVEITAFNKV